MDFNNFLIIRYEYLISFLFKIQNRLGLFNIILTFKLLFEFSNNLPILS